MTSAICCPLWSPVYECHEVECAFTSSVRTECCMFVVVVVCPFQLSSSLIQVLRV